MKSKEEIQAAYDLIVDYGYRHGFEDETDRKAFAAAADALGWVLTQDGRVMDAFESSLQELRDLRR